MTALALLLAVWLLLLAAYAPRLRADWREPVLGVPVLVIESDDWGPGPPADAARLAEISAVLRRFGDGSGAPAAMTIGVVLAVPDGPGDGGEIAYRPRPLDAREFAPIRNALLAGRDAGVFSLQLHGMVHFWPAALLAAAATDSSARAFLASRGGDVRHEALPSHLQARWIDASRLPSVALDSASIVRAATDEVACYERVFGGAPAVAVPVTFTWTPEVESAWAAKGVRAVVTPGTRYTGRDAAGRLTGDGAVLRNGDRGAGGVVFVVRDVYFEPARGHRADDVLRQVRERHRLGRPALLEMHRFNFTGDADEARRSLAELERLVQLALAGIAGLRFLSTEALARCIVARDPALIDRRAAARVRTFVRRAATLSRLRKLAWLTGLALPVLLAYAVADALAGEGGGRG